MKKKEKVGLAFFDFVEGKTFSNKSRGYGNIYKASNLPLLIPIISLCSVFLVLLVRLFYVQVVQGAYYKNLANSNRTKTLIIPSPRGIIFDTNNRPLVRNVPVFGIIKGKTVEVIDHEEGMKLLKNGKDVVNSVAREYLYKEAFAHVLGYTGQMTSDQLNLPEFKNYGITDSIGKMGLESEYESILHGENGLELYEVNANGVSKRFLGKSEPVPGKNLNTTINLDIQLSAVKAFKDIEKGAVVVSDPNNGGILAIYSKPSFDSNLFSHGKGYETDGGYRNVEEILNDLENQPLLDRAIGGAYPPGSTFKLVTSMAGLERGDIKKDTIIEDTGNITVGGTTFGNWYFIQYGRLDGPLDVVGAIKRSNDIFFYRTAGKIGVDNLSSWARKFNLGENLGIDLPGEIPGTVPSSSWKKRVIGEQWYLGDTFNYGIGQGYLLTTPLQINMMTTVFANNGILYKPHVLKKNPEILKKDFVSIENINLVRQGMKESCDTGGVAWPFFQFKVKNSELRIDGKDFMEDSSGSAKMTRVTIGCKTGTAEIGDAQTKPHAWITVMAPFAKPEIVVTVLVENGGEGSSIAGPIAANIIRDYFEKK